MFEQIYCVNSGRYSFIRMTGIVSEDTNSTTSMGLPIAVRLRTPYRNRDGRYISITVALGSSVPINLILSNAWLKMLDAIIDYGTNKLMVDFQDHGRFSLTYHHPRCSMIDATHRHERKYFKDMMPIMTSLANVVNIYSPDSAWLPHVQTMIQHYQVQTLKATMISTPMSPGCALRPSKPALN